jgi:hypothetical protein
LPLNGQNGSKITPWTPYIQSSNLVVARSTRAGGASIFHKMDSTEDIQLIKLLLARLERVSVDSYWAHRASGVRGALLKNLEELEKGTFTGQTDIDDLISSSFNILNRAAREKH